MTGWEELDDFCRAWGINIGPPRIGQTTGGAHVTGSNHYKGLARDYGDADSDCWAVASALLPFTDLLLELYFAPMGIWHPRNAGGHRDHVHAAIRPGVSLPRPPIPQKPPDPWADLFVPILIGG